MTNRDSDEPASSVGAGRSPSDTGELHARLLESSSSFAQSAIAAYTAESWELYYLHLATAVELLVKAVLARAHPTLIADTRASFDSLLHLCGLGHRARVPEFVAAVRTVSATEAMQRVERVVDGYRHPGADVQLLLELRNGIVHSGELARSQSEAILGAVGEYTDTLLPSVGMSRARYWGHSAALVEDHSRRRLSELEASFRRKLESSKSRFRRITESMERTEKSAFIAALTTNSISDAFDEVPAPCPACGSPGVLYGYPDPQWEADWDVEGNESFVSGAYVKAIVVQGTSFSCRVCGLNLDSMQLGFADLEAVTLGDEDFELSTATSYFEVDAIVNPSDYDE